MHERINQDRHDPQGFCQIVHYCIQFRLLFRILSQDPRGLFINIFIRPSYHDPDFFQRHVEGEFIHLGFHLGSRAGGDGLQVAVDVVLGLAFRNKAAAVFLDHGNGSGNQVAQVVGQVVVHSLQHHLIGEDAVLPEGVLPQQEVFQGVDAVALDEDHRIHHVFALGGFGLGNLFAAQQQPAVTQNLLRQRQVCTHQHGRPDHRMEPDDFLAHQVHVRRPVFVIQFRFIRIAQCGDVVGQRIQPYIDDMLFIDRNRNPPVKGGP